MGSLVSPSWQQRRASGEAYWPTAGPGEGMHRGTPQRHISFPTQTSRYTRTHPERPGTQVPGQWRESPSTFNPRIWVSGPKYHMRAH